MSQPSKPAPIGPFKCPGCANLRPAGYVACKPCWSRLPFSLRRAFTKADTEGKRSMLRDILKEFQTLAGK